MNSYVSSTRRFVTILIVTLYGCLGFVSAASAQVAFVASTTTTTMNAVALDAMQSHPCDQATTGPVVILSGAAYRVQFCSPQSDAPTAVKATVDAAVYDQLPVTAKTVPSATGMVLYETSPFFQVAKGSHSLVLTVYNVNALTGQTQLGAASSPFPFSAVDDTPPPTAPVVKGLIKG